MDNDQKIECQACDVEGWHVFEDYSDKCICCGYVLVDTTGDQS